MIPHLLVEKSPTFNSNTSSKKMLHVLECRTSTLPVLDFVDMWNVYFRRFCLSIFTFGPLKSSFSDRPSETIRRASRYLKTLSCPSDEPTRDRLHFGEFEFDRRHVPRAARRSTRRKISMLYLIPSKNGFCSNSNFFSNFSSL